MLNDENQVETVEVCVIGLGVSSLALVRSLALANADFIVVSEMDFGIWATLDAIGEDFDLLSSNALASFSWWDLDDDFEFYSASEYYARLKREITPKIRARLRRGRAESYTQREDDTYDVRIRGREGQRSTANTWSSPWARGSTVPRYAAPCSRRSR